MVWNMNLIFHFIYGMSSFPLTNIFQDGYGTTSQIKLVAQKIIQNWTMFLYWNNHKPMVHFRKAPTVGLYKVRVLGEEGLRTSQSVSYLCNPLYKWTSPIYNIYIHIYIYISKYKYIYISKVFKWDPNIDFELIECIEWLDLLRIRRQNEARSSIRSSANNQREPTITKPMFQGAPGHETGGWSLSYRTPQEVFPWFPNGLMLMVKITRSILDG